MFLLPNMDSLPNLQNEPYSESFVTWIQFNHHRRSLILNLIDAFGQLLLLDFFLCFLFILFFIMHLFDNLLQSMDPESVQEGQKRMKALFQKYVSVSEGLIFSSLVLSFVPLLQEEVPYFAKLASCFGIQKMSYSFFIVHRTT